NGRFLHRRAQQNAGAPLAWFVTAMHRLPRILNGTDWWCQGYSEPGAGSDLAGLQTSAMRDGDHYIVNGQKTWTTLGQHANMMFCLVRTSREGRKQQGISFLLMDMKAKGVEVRPIRLLDGEAEVNDVFFTDVRVPVENLVGTENHGWTYAKYLLGYERTNIAGVGASEAAFRHLREIVKAQRTGDGTSAEEILFAARLARLEIRLENMRTTNLRVLAATEQGVPFAAGSSMLKLLGTEIRQEITACMRRALGSYAQPFVSEALEGDFAGEAVGPSYGASVATQYFNNRKLSIFGGSNEIQRDIIAKDLLEF
ncbi:acyl-CoA dehydrogenase family protein, partial [Sphingobium mellinum]|uniref:acyl-CoA dehydrogenase family protein n=1 Tax=Sphingobium mellinum TaxID=1387166 RepID=UPI0030EC280A